MVAADSVAAGWVAEAVGSVVARGAAEMGVEARGAGWAVAEI